MRVCAHTHTPECNLWIKSIIYYVQRQSWVSMLVAWWRRHFMLLECLDAQGTFLQQFTFDSIGFPSEADGERDRGGKRGTYGGTERERKCKKIQVWRNIVKLPPARMEHLFFLFFIHSFSRFCCRHNLWLFNSLFSLKLLMIQTFYAPTLLPVFFIFPSHYPSHYNTQKKKLILK